MKLRLSTLAGLALAGVLGLAAMPANAWWGGWDDDYYDYYGPWGGGPWYGGYPGYGYGGYPGRGWGYPQAVTPVQPSAPASTPAK